MAKSKAKAAGGPAARPARAKAAKPAPLDLYKQFKAQYAASQDPAMLDVPAATYLTVVGQGAPGGPAFTEAVGACTAWPTPSR